jgi:serine O-acetyltransferase
MLDHIHVMDQRIEAMSAALERNGITGHFDQLPDLPHCELDRDGGISRSKAAD